MDFNTELERHRKILATRDIGSSQCASSNNAVARLGALGALNAVIEAVEFLLAVAHQPVEGGVVDVGSESPSDGIHREHGEDRSSNIEFRLRLHRERLDRIDTLLSALGDASGTLAERIADIERDQAVADRARRGAAGDPLQTAYTRIDSLEKVLRDLLRTFDGSTDWGLDERLRAQAVLGDGREREQRARQQVDLACQIRRDREAQTKPVERSCLCGAANAPDEAHCVAGHPLKTPLGHERDLLDEAWGIIANANNGNWDQNEPEWRKAAETWRDRYRRHRYPEPR